MKGRLLLLVCLMLVLNLSPGAVQPARAAEGACLAWDISGVWAYSVSGGFWGTITFQQDPTTGLLTGTWHNEAKDIRGTIVDGGVVGSRVGFHPTPTETVRGTVSADGTVVQGTVTFPSGENGYWKMTGQARCTARQPIPPQGSARVTVWWGDYVYRLALDPPSALSTRAPRWAREVARIRYPYGTRIQIEAIYYGENLPQNLRVIIRWDGQVERAGTLNRVWTNEDGGVAYVGLATIPQRQVGPGEEISDYVYVVSPWGWEDLVAIFDRGVVDPSGYIYDADTYERIQDAMVSCYVRKGSSWVLWDAEAWKQTNPLVSSEVGYYGWDVPQGDYKVQVSHDCYQDAESPVLTVPPPRTDVNFALKKVACSALYLLSVWTSDGGALPKDEFLPSEPIQYHAQIANSETRNIPVQLAWTVTDPDGKRVDALSGSGVYDIADFGAKLAIDETLPSNLAKGTYRLTIQLTHQQQTRRSVTQFWVQTREERSVYLPLVLENHRVAAAQGGIHGRVTYEGRAAPGIPLHLRFWNGSSWSTAATTRTDGDGRYVFTGVSSLGPGEEYYVRFGHNDSDPQVVSNWFAPSIRSYAAGTRVAGGDFDIANVKLLSPAADATVRLPQIFKWTRRGQAGDTYRLRMLDATMDYPWTSDDLGDTGSFTLTGMPPCAVQGRECWWSVLVYNGPNNYGLSYYEHRIRFSASQGRTIQPQLQSGSVETEPTDEY